MFEHVREEKRLFTFNSIKRITEKCFFSYVTRSFFFHGFLLIISAMKGRKTRENKSPLLRDSQKNFLLCWMS